MCVVCQFLGLTFPSVDMQNILASGMKLRLIVNSIYCIIILSLCKSASLKSTDFKILAKEIGILPV